MNVNVYSMVAYCTSRPENEDNQDGFYWIIQFFFIFSVANRSRAVLVPISR